MKNKIFGIFLSMLLISTTIIIYPNSQVKATQEGSYEDIILDYQYIFNISKILSEVIAHFA